VGTRRVRLGCVGVAAGAVLLVAVAYGAIFLSLPHHELPDTFDFHGEDITAARRVGVSRIEA
jgi:hypothetical protein